MHNSHHSIAYGGDLASFNKLKAKEKYSNSILKSNLKGSAIKLGYDDAETIVMERWLDEERGAVKQAAKEG